MRVLAVVLLSALIGCTAATLSQSPATTTPPSFTTTPPAGITASRYSSCPPPPLEGCNCRDNSYGPAVNVNAVDGAIDTCMASLSNSGHTTLYSLFVEGYPPLSLEKNNFLDVQFKELHVSQTTLQRVDENFLGNSSNFTTNIYFYSCTLLEGIPKINAGVLQYLDFYDVSYSPHINLTLRKETCSGTPVLKFLAIRTSDARVMTVQRHVFRSLTKLREVDFRGSYRFRFGAGHFASPDLSELYFGRFGYDATFGADPGSFEGIPAGAELFILGGQVTGGWSPSKFFNIFRGGAFIHVYDDHECGCDLAWIRYSSFLGQVDINCLTGEGSSIPLSEFNLSDCQFYNDKSLHRTEL